MVMSRVRGGAELRKRAAKIDRDKKGRYPCPTCGKKSLKRKGNSIWNCRSCDSTYAGGAYSPTTPGGSIAAGIVSDAKSKSKPKG
ncbi:MAG: 50S ribosomal protein L37ae [Candidatus Micrarchaeota archaeon]|nr:50S ribosomal protein L37ae [Candidatus Micrarchaeota archaeon]